MNLYSRTYEIKTIDDIFSIPADRRADFFVELEAGLLLAEKAKDKAVARLPRWMRWLIRKTPHMKEFLWIDDGLRNESTTMEFCGIDLN